MLLVAQLAERQIVTLDVVGSSPTFQPKLCRYSIMAIMSAFQAEDVGSIPITCSIARIGPAL